MCVLLLMTANVEFMLCQIRLRFLFLELHYSNLKDSYLVEEYTLVMKHLRRKNCLCKSNIYMNFQ